MHHAFFPFFLFIPLFWIVVLVVLGAVFGGRRRRRWAAAGFGPWGAYGAGFAGHAAARSAETTLAERFAQGDIDEKEYRARLEVLRANNPAPQMPQR